MAVRETPTFFCLRKLSQVNSLDTFHKVDRNVRFSDACKGKSDIHYRPLRQVISASVAIACVFFCPIRLVTSAELAQISTSLHNSPTGYPQKSTYSVKLTKLTLSNDKTLPDFERLANAIYKAEGGSKTRHPYGILIHYKHTSPKQACINTLKSALKSYYSHDQSESFISYLSKTYCPINDPRDISGLNKNWVRNVSYFYNKEAV